jgi:hypothetical protein
MQKTVHVWEKVEITLQAENDYRDFYNEVDVFIDLKGPGFSKRCYGFWDGGKVFRIRILAPAEGEWAWESGSNQDDPGLNGKTGSFAAVAWSEEEKLQNPVRRGFVRPTANGRALEYADGTPFYLCGDTWWSLSSFRFIWYDDDNPRPFTEEMGFKDMVKFRKGQGFNSVNIIACFPNWRNDGFPARMTIDDEKKTMLRAAWEDPDTDLEEAERTQGAYPGITAGFPSPPGMVLTKERLDYNRLSAKDMHNEGGLPFSYPGVIPGYEDMYPDMTKINPGYFKVLDKKLDYLGEYGFTPFLEAIRRDATQAWFNYYPWPGSFLRYVFYIFARYQANNLILSPIHYDYGKDGIHPKYFNDVMDQYLNKYGKPPFGTVVSANAPSSTLSAFGGKKEAPWIDLHQIGNVREHEYYWLLTEIFNAEPSTPAMDGEPYYSGWGLNLFGFSTASRVKMQMPGTPEDDRFVRNGMYGSFLSGGFAGYVYGTVGIVRGDREKACKACMWDGIQYSSANMVVHFRSFVFSEGGRYKELIPMSDMVSPNKTHEILSYKGWAFAARTKERDLIMVYYEKDCPANRLRSVLSDGIYKATWFDPRTGEWIDTGVLNADSEERINRMPQKPTDDDWCLKLNLIGRNDRDHSIYSFDHSASYIIADSSDKK